MGEGAPQLGLKVWERGRENGSFSVEEGSEVKDRVLETVGFQGVNPICDGGGGLRRLKGRPYNSQFKIYNYPYFIKLPTLRALARKSSY